MKHLFILLVFVFAVSVAIAQDVVAGADPIQKTFGKEKAELVKEVMAIPVDLDAAFWTEYDKYEEEREALETQKLALLTEFTKNYDSLDEKKASALLTANIKLIDDRNRMQKKYLASMAKIIGVQKAARFLQLEDYLENIIRAGAAQTIPFIGELDRNEE